MARQGLADVGVGRVGAIAEERHQAHEDAGSAEAALERVGVLEGGLQRMQLALRSRQALDGRQRVPVGLYGKQQARAYGLVIEQDGTSAAHSVLAAHMRPGQVQVLAKKIGQQEPRFDLVFVDGAIDGYLDGDEVRHGLIRVERLQRVKP